MRAAAAFRVGCVLLGVLLAGPASAAERKSQAGESCVTDLDCAKSFQCVDESCVSALIEVGEACTRTTDCAEGLGCIKQRCVERSPKSTALPEPPKEPDAGGSRDGAYVALGVGSGFMVLGAVLLGVGVNEYSNFTDKREQLLCTEAPPACPPYTERVQLAAEASDQRETALALEAAGAVTMSVGMVGLVVGLVLLATSDDDAPVGAWVAPSVLPDGSVGTAATWRF